MQNVHDETVWGIMIALAGAVLVTAALVHIWRKRRCTCRVTATCVDVTGEKIPDLSPRCRIYPIWRFRYRGKLYRVQDTQGSSADLLRVGRREVLFIDPDDPERIRHPGEGWLLVGVGGFAILCGGLLAALPYFSI